MMRQFVPIDFTPSMKDIFGALKDFVGFQAKFNQKGCDFYIPISLPDFDSSESSASPLPASLLGARTSSGRVPGRPLSYKLHEKSASVVLLSIKNYGCDTGKYESVREAATINLSSGYCLDEGASLSVPYLSLYYQVGDVENTSVLSSASSSSAAAAAASTLVEYFDTDRVQTRSSFNLPHNPQRSMAIHGINCAAPWRNEAPIPQVRTLVDFLVTAHVDYSVFFNRIPLEAMKSSVDKAPNANAKYASLNYVPSIISISQSSRRWTGAWKARSLERTLKSRLQQENVKRQAAIADLESNPKTTKKQKSKK